ncbi:MAG: DUF192 domain-containing protein [Polyangiaceae bacterium]
MSRRISLSLAHSMGLAVIALSGCDKAPPEPAAQLTAVTATPVVSRSPTTPPRPGPKCLHKMSATPPPPPRYAVDPACPKDPAGGPPMVPVGHVAFPESKDAPRLEVELMLKSEHQERGMMYRKSIADDKGMLFAWAEPLMHSFWMHNCCIALDMLFIDKQGFVTGIVENAPTMNDDPRTIECAVPFVLEVAAGWSRKHGVAPGQRVEIEGVPPLGQ